MYKTFSSVYGLKRAPKIWNGTLRKFKVPVEKEVTKLVGYEFDVTEGSVKLKQESYIKKLVEAFGLEDGRSYETPKQSDLDLEKNNGKLLEDKQLYQALLGALLFVNLGLEISFAVNN